MQKHPQQPQEYDPFDRFSGREMFDNTFSVASATECTGMIPTPAQNDPEVESYSAIYDIPLSCDNAEKNQQKETKPPRPTDR